MKADAIDSDRKAPSSEVLRELKEDMQKTKRTVTRKLEMPIKCHLKPKKKPKRDFGTKVGIHYRNLRANWTEGRIDEFSF